MKTTVFALAAASLMVPAAALAVDVVRITEDGTADRYPAISGSNVVWQHCEGSTSPICLGGDDEIYFWDGSFPIGPIQVTHNSVPDWLPAISGSNVVWQSWDGHDWEIYFWDGSFPVAPVQITDNGLADTHPVISGSNVAWEQCDAIDARDLCSTGDTEIYFWDGTFPIVPTRITDNGINDSMPAISGSKLAWEGYEDVVPVTSIDIYFWDGSFPVAPMRITDDDALDWRPAISGSTVVWVGPLDGLQQILRWDGSLPVVPTPISESAVGGFLPAISGSNLVWQKGPFGATDIYFWDGVTTTPITDDSGFEDKNPDVSGSTVVWEKCVFDSELGCLTATSEIYMATVPTAPAVPSISSSGMVLLAGLMMGSAICIASRSRPQPRR